MARTGMVLVHKRLEGGSMSCPAGFPRRCSSPFAIGLEPMAPRWLTVVAKFGDHPPFYRQAEIFKRQGLWNRSRQRSFDPGDRKKVEKARHSSIWIGARSATGSVVLVST